MDNDNHNYVYLVSAAEGWQLIFDILPADNLLNGFMYNNALKESYDHLKHSTEFLVGPKGYKWVTIF